MMLNNLSYVTTNDLLKFHDIIVHNGRNTLSHNPSATTINAYNTVRPLNVPILRNVDVFSQKIHELLKEFPELTKEKSPSEVVKH